MMTARSDSAPMGAVTPGRVRVLAVLRGSRAAAFDFLDPEQLQMRSGRFERPVMRSQLGVGDQHVNPGVVQDVIDLVGFEEIVDRHDHRACLKDAKERRDELRAVLEPEPHPVTRLDPEPPLEQVRDKGSLLPQLLVGVFSLAPEEGVFLEVLLYGVTKGASQVHNATILRTNSAAGQGGVRTPGELNGQGLARCVATGSWSMRLVALHEKPAPE